MCAHLTAQMPCWPKWASSVQWHCRSPLSTISSGISRFDLLQTDTTANLGSTPHAGFCTLLVPGLDCHQQVNKQVAW